MREIQLGNQPVPVVQSLASWIENLTSIGCEFVHLSNLLLNLTSQLSVTDKSIL